MIGNNSMSMCKAMMIEMVQHFFDTKLLKEGVVVKVTDVKEKKDLCPTFEVSFDPFFHRIFVSMIN